MKKFENVPGGLHPWFSRLAEVMPLINEFRVSLDPTSVSANTTSEQTFTVPGINAVDIILSITKPTHTSGLGIVGHRVSAKDTIAITFMNTTVGSIDPGSETYIIIVLRG